MIPSLAAVCENALRLPCSPVLMPRIMKVLAQEEAAVHELERVIRLDPALAASTLRLANSAYFAAGSGLVENLEEAIQRLGQREIYRLAALALTGRWMNTKVQGYGWEPSDFCRFALVTAIAAEYLARKSGLVDEQTSYTAGLVHELGKLAIAYSCGDHFQAIRESQKNKATTWLVAETAVLGYNHAVAGAELLRRWNFPESLVAVAHYNPVTASAPAALLPLLVHVHAAKFIASSIGAGVAEDGFLFELNTPLLAQCGFTSQTIEAAMPEVFTRATKLLQDKLTHGSLTF